MTLEDNDLLGSLPLEEGDLLSARSVPMTFRAGDILFEPGDPLEAVYIPLGTSLVSFVVSIDGGLPVETALIGREGLIGSPNGGDSSAFARVTVVLGGKFLRISAGDIDSAKRQSPAIASLFARYADCFLAQILQSVACNAVHTLEQRAARWLTAVVDRTGDRNISLTQEQLGALLGAGRSYTSRQIQRFKSQHLLRTRRGGIIIVDYEGMLDRACTCHRRVRQHYDKVLRNGISAEATA